VRPADTAVREGRRRPYNQPAYTLDEVAKGYEDMHAGKNIRGVIVFD
jgi:Zn-dependent alcohol dehydrogenase